MATVAVVSLSACSNDMQDLNTYISEVKARPSTPIDAIPPVKTYSPYPYSGDTGRDPFRSSTSEGTEAMATGSGDTSDSTGPRPDFERAKQYLERFELDTLLMVGTFGKDTGYWGLVRDPDGVVHRVSLDDYVGKNHGKIVGIQDSEILLTELISDGTGGWLVREATIALDGS